jgi:uncharacterized membrane protein YedE/YeeE
VADPISKLVLGLLTGFVFGFVLQKGQVTKYAVIVGQFLLRDFTVLKTMLTAIVVGGAGVYALRAAGLASLHVKPAQLAAVSVGGVVFGVGMVLLGYCPGTGVAAAAEGRRDAMAGVAGMLVGAVAFSTVYASLSRTLLTWANLGPVTLVDVTGAPAWVLLGVLGAGAVGLFRWLERREG